MNERVCKELSEARRDVVIIGGGVGGLTAAAYLGRFHRPALVMDAGASRARWIPESHNIPGFPEGVGGRALLTKLLAQAEQYGATVLREPATSVGRAGERFEVGCAGRIIDAHYVIVATGVQDQLPTLLGAQEAMLRSLIRVCPICDGYEASGKRIAVLGDGSAGEQEAIFLRTYSKDITLLHVGTKDPDTGRRDRMAQEGIEVLEIGLVDLIVNARSLGLRRPNKPDRTFEVVYAALGCRPRNGLVTALGTRCDDRGAIVVNQHQMTSVEGLYAIGDVVRGLSQVVVAAAEAAIAATDIHNRLRRRQR